MTHLAADHSWSETVSVSTKFRGTTSVNGSTAFPGAGNIIRDFAFIGFNDHQNNYTFSGTAAGSTVVLETVNNEQKLIYRR